MKKISLSGALLCVLIAVSANAALITVDNPSFEYSGGSPITVKTMGIKPDNWDFGNGMPTGGGIESPSSDGAVCVAVKDIDSIYQLTDHTIADGDQYTLTFDAYYLWASGGAAYNCTFQGRLYYDDGGSRTVIDNVQDTLTAFDMIWYGYTLNTTIPPGHAAIGNKLGIELTANQGAGGDSWFGFDNVGLLSVTPRILPASTFYIDSITGNDGNDGLSPGQAWQSLAPVNSMPFIPGDKILFKADTSYTGQLKPQGSGADGNPIIIDMYGTGNKPAINGEGILDTVLLKNVEYIEVSNLEITNLGASRQNWRTGIKIWANNYGTVNHVHLKDLYVHDVNGSLDKSTEGCGIYIESSGSTQSRFDDVLVENCHVLRTDRNGICMRSSFVDRSGNWFPSLNVMIRYNLVEDCGGDAIKPWGADGCRVEHNIVDRARQRCSDYAAGIWPWSCDNTVIQFNEVSGMKGTLDGQGFDSDYNCTNSKFQYNYSHDNDGGFILIVGPYAAPGSWDAGCKNTVVRYNISQNDGINSARVFHISGGGVDNTTIYNNIIYLAPSQNLPLLLFGNWSGWPNNTKFYNNIFYVDGTATYNFGSSTNNVFRNNVFYGNHVSPPADPCAITSDPLLVSVGSGGSGLDSLDGYKLSPSSPCITAGKTVAANGKFDYFRNRLDPAELPDIGAHAYTNTYPGDIDADHDVDGADLRLFVPDWLGIFMRTDLNGDGRVDAADFAIFEQDWQENF